MSVDESEHAAPFLHGLLLHSLTSISQLPPRVRFALLSITEHSVSYSLMKLYEQAPFAKPATHEQRYEWKAMAKSKFHQTGRTRSRGFCDIVYTLPFSGESTVESAQCAPLKHGALLHSSTSISQLPPKYVALVGLSMLSITMHSVVYSRIKPYSPTPLAKPATHVH